MVFVNSMSDLFHDGVPDDYVLAVARVMEMAEWHTFQVLTKRADRLRRLLSGKLGFAAALPNVWWGVSVEDRRFGVPRVAELQAAPARTRFLSIEPLLEDVGELDLRGIHWVIVGGESGPGARPCHIEWVRSVNEQCGAAGVPCFVKQLGTRPQACCPDHRCPHDLALRDRKGGDPAEWPEDLRNRREFPAIASGAVGTLTSTARRRS